MKTGVIRGQKQLNERNSAGMSTLLCANWLKNYVCKGIFLLSSYSVRTFPIVAKVGSMDYKIDLRHKSTNISC